MTTVVLHIEDAEVEKFLQSLQSYKDKVKVIAQKHHKVNAIDQLLAQPLQITNFQPLKRNEVNPFV